MTNIDDILASLAPETNSIDEFDRLLVHFQRDNFRALYPDELARIVEATMPLGRYGARARNCLRTYYSF